MNLYDTLKKYAETDAYPFHMPGHKRRMGVPVEACALDITEIDGFDNLHHAEGILKEAQEKAARLYGAEDTYYLVNGSTAGILAAISASVSRGGKLLMARNSHKAAYHAAELRGLHTVYLYPREACLGKSVPDGPGQEKDVGERIPCGRILPEDVRAALERDREIEAVFITSPTYEGIVSDAAEIARIAHSFGVPLIVDEAHGAHFGFHPDFPESSVRLGADLVVHSLHKTLPAMTQTALLHRNGSLVRGSRIQKFLDIYQTSSPSYVMMASIDACIDLLSVERDTLFRDFSIRLKEFYRQTKALRHFYFMRYDETDKDKTDADETGVALRDFSRLVFGAYGYSGKWLADTLRERFSLEMEMAAGAYVVAITTVADTQEGFDRLLAALRTLDAELERECHARAGVQTAVRRPAADDGAANVTVTNAPAAGDVTSGVPAANNTTTFPAQALTLAEAEERPHRRIPLAGAEGQICGEYIYQYPPGIPLIVPGERISRALLAQLQTLKREGYSLQGMSDYSVETVEIV